MCTFMALSEAMTACAQARVAAKGVCQYALRVRCRDVQMHRYKGKMN